MALGSNNMKLKRCKFLLIFLHLLYAKFLKRWSTSRTEGNLFRFPVHSIATALKFYPIFLIRNVYPPADSLTRNDSPKFVGPPLISAPSNIKPYSRDTWPVRPSSAVRRLFCISTLYGCNLSVSIRPYLTKQIFSNHICLL